MRISKACFSHPLKISKACFSHPLKIGIDCRMYGLKHAGIGRYVMNLVEELLKQDKENEYVLFINDDESIKTQIYSSNFKTVVVEVPHYSLKEQLLMPGIVAREKVDLMHFPHFNVPVFYQGKYVVTIHDLIKHASKGMTTTTRSPLLYWLKFLGYKIVFRQAVRRAEKIITPSQFVKNEVIKEYGVKPGKVVVTYEGVDDMFKVQSAKCKVTVQSSKLLKKYNIKKPYLLYVGSVYPHKNIERLIEAVKLLNNKYLTSDILHITLVIVCARNVFSERLRNKVVQMEAQEFVNLAGFVPDEDLAVLYRQAEAFVFPPLLEGFGLPGLEAMSVGCPVLCSNIPVLREVYGEAALYFDPLNPEEMAKKMVEVIDQKGKRDKMAEKGKRQAEKYSWSKMAKEILKVYSSV